MYGTGKVPITLLEERYFLASFLARTKSFASSLVFRVVGLLSVPERKQAKNPTTRNTRYADDFVHAKKLARKKRSASRVGTNISLKKKNVLKPRRIPYCRAKSTLLNSGPKYLTLCSNRTLLYTFFL